jgi:hypothetical protein
MKYFLPHTERRMEFWLERARPASMTGHEIAARL